VIRPLDSTSTNPPGDELPDAAVTLRQVLAELSTIRLFLRDALNRQADDRPRVEPLALRLDELADALGVNRRTLERERAAGRLPRPDLKIGKMPLWRVETVRDWLKRGGFP
jgi:predicted DNA-binding transcriptional regulator AlpA